MGYHFSPDSDFQQLEQSLARLYTPERLPAQLERCRGVLAGLKETFGPCAQAAVFSAPGRTEICGNHTDHQHGLVLAGSIDLDVIAAVAPNGENVIRIHSECFPMDIVELDSL